MTTALLLALYGGIFWSVVIWYIERLTDMSDEPIGVLSLITLIGLIFLRGESKGKGEEFTSQSASFSELFRAPIASIICLAIYASTWFFAPKLLSAVFAVMAIGFLIHSRGGRLKLGLGEWLLLLLSLPIVSSLNFYVGYPLRILVGMIAAPSLSMLGFPAVAQGTAIVWNHQLVEIDAPCSGVKMLWFAVYLGATLSTYLEVKGWRVVLLLLFSVIASFVANVLRVTSLFYVETGILNFNLFSKEFVHQAIGVVSFALSAGLTLFLSFRFAGNIGNETKKVKVETPKRVHFEKWKAVVFAFAAFSAAIIPLFTSSAHSKAVAMQTTQAFPGWPKRFEGLPLQELPAEKNDETFARDFPGKLKCFAIGDRKVILRWVTKPTRQLHPSSDCYRGLGYSITWLPMETDREGRKWSCFEARKEKETILAKERITDSKGGSWTDVSSWYWAAVSNQTAGPWWSTVVVARGGG